MYFQKLKAEEEEQQKNASSRSQTRSTKSVREVSTAGSNRGLLSREGTSVSIDEEIKDIMNQENTQDGVSSVTSVTSGSRQGARSAVSIAAPKTPQNAEPESVNRDRDLDSSMSQRSKSVASLSKIIEEHEVVEEGKEGQEEKEEKEEKLSEKPSTSGKRREVVLGEKISYVEVNAGGGDDNDDAFRVRHLSPITSGPEVTPRAGSQQEVTGDAV